VYDLILFQIHTKKKTFSNRSVILIFSSKTASDVQTSGEENKVWSFIDWRERGSQSSWVGQLKFNYLFIVNKIRNF